MSDLTNTDAKVGKAMSYFNKLLDKCKKGDYVNGNEMKYLEDYLDGVTEEFQKEMRVLNVKTDLS